MEMLKCTKVEVIPIKGHKQIKANVKIVLNEQLQLTGLRIEDGCHGFHVTYPEYYPKDEGNKCPWIFYPITKELREHIELCALEKYQELRDA